MPMRSAVVRDKDGVTCTTTEAQNERWRRRFSKILNEFDLEELGRVKQRPLRPDLAGFPTEEELMRAIKSLKSGKAGGDTSRDSEGCVHWRQVSKETAGVST